MSAPAPAATATATSVAPPVKSKKLLIIILSTLFLILAVGGGLSAWVMSSRASAELDDDEEGGNLKKKVVPSAPPTFLAMENMVANLADPGGNRFAQIGITLELADEKTAADIKSYLPSIRSGILLLVSQRTSAELLKIEGKEKLANDILKEVSKPLGYDTATDQSPSGRNRKKDDGKNSSQVNPVQRILFSSFIVQ